MRLGANPVNMLVKQTGVVNMEGTPSKTHRPNNHPSNPIERKPAKKPEIPVVSNPEQKEAQRASTHEALKVGIIVVGALAVFAIHHLV